MRKPSPTHVGPQSARSLLTRYACPIPFHAVRTRFLGNIATPTLDASPVQTIKRLWGGELPKFNDMAAVNELFEALMRLWNELAQHQSDTKPYRLVRMTVTPTPDNLQRVCRTRVEELEGFIDGLFGDEDAIDLPERATEALHHLGEINAMMRGILDRMERESAPPASKQGVVALRIVPGPHDAHRQDPHLPMRYDTGRPRAIIRLRISQPRTASLPCPAGLRARRPSPMMDL